MCPERSRIETAGFQLRRGVRWVSRSGGSGASVEQMGIHCWAIYSSVAEGKLQFDMLLRQFLKVCAPSARSSIMDSRTAFLLLFSSQFGQHSRCLHCFLSAMQLLCRVASRPSAPY